MHNIEKAIEWLKGMYYSTDQYSTDDGYSKEEYHNEIIDLAVKALQEKLERENPQPLGCKYCLTNKLTEKGLSIISSPSFSLDIGKATFSSDHFLVVSEYEELRNIKGRFSNSPIRGKNVRINFCPMCGRRLNSDIVNVNKIEHIGEANEMIEGD